MASGGRWITSDKGPFRYLVAALAESGLLIERFAENLSAAILPKAAIKLILTKEAANDPKRTFNISLTRANCDFDLARFPLIFGLRVPRSRYNPS